MLGNLFYRGITPHELKEMEYPELKYWNDWHKVLIKASGGEEVEVEVKRD
ncbi:MAG: hypothetical protein ACTSPB_12885 [Candidatus Thorarchaeota archaeon]